LFLGACERGGGFKGLSYGFWSVNYNWHDEFRVGESVGENEEGSSQDRKTEKGDKYRSLRRRNLKGCKWGGDFKRASR